MKDWALTLILCSVLWSGVTLLIPKGEKSPLYGPVRLLFSLVLILALFSPLVGVLTGKDEITLPDYGEGETNSGDGGKEIQRLILEKNVSKMEEAVKNAFPEAEFSLRLEASADGIPTGIYVIGRDAEEGKRIADFLEQNFQLITSFEPENQEDGA